jgi:hypothetical protein
MRFGEERSPQLSTSELLKVNAIFFEIGRILGNLIPKVMKVYSWGTPPTIVHTGSLIKEHKVNQCDY